MATATRARIATSQGQCLVNKRHTSAQNEGDCNAVEEEAAVVSSDFGLAVEDEAAAVSSDFGMRGALGRTTIGGGCGVAELDGGFVEIAGIVELG